METHEKEKEESNESDKYETEESKSDIKKPEE